RLTPKPRLQKQFVTQAAVEAFDEAVLHRLARPREVERYALLIGPEIEIAADELRALVDAYGLGLADIAAAPLNPRHGIFAAVTEPRIEGRREPGKGIHDGQDPDLAPGGQLVVDKVHGPGLVDLDGDGAILPLRLHPAFRGLVTQLQPHLLVKTIDQLR